MKEKKFKAIVAPKYNAHKEGQIFSPSYYDALPWVVLKRVEDGSYEVVEKSLGRNKAQAEQMAEELNLGESNERLPEVHKP